MFFGTSTSVLQDKSDLECMLDLEPEMVRASTIRASALPRIESSAAPGNWRSHCTHRLLTIRSCRSAVLRPVARIQRRQERLFRWRLTRCAASGLNAIHVVVHFPSPYADCAEPISDQTIDAFLDPLMNRRNAFASRYWSRTSLAIPHFIVLSIPRTVGSIPQSWLLP